MNQNYVHGYDQRETIRLQDQASTLVELLHSDTSYPAGSQVLEAGYSEYAVGEVVRRQTSSNSDR